MSAHGISIYTVPSPYLGLAPRHSPVNHRTMAPAPTLANLAPAYQYQLGPIDNCFSPNTKRRLTISSHKHGARQHGRTVFTALHQVWHNTRGFTTASDHQIIGGHYTELMNLLTFQSKVSNGNLILIFYVCCDPWRGEHFVACLQTACLLFGLVLATAC